MQNLKSLFIVFIATFSIAILFSSCQKDEVKTEPTPEVKLEDLKILNTSVPNETIKKLNAIHVNANGVQNALVSRPDGSQEEVLLLEGDMIMTNAQLNEMFSNGPVDFTNRQYRTQNLVTNNRTIRVLGYTGGSYALTDKMKTALEWSVSNYNALNIGLNFTFSFGTNMTNKDIVVYKTFNPNAGGVAGFPYGGNPYKWVGIHAGTDSYSHNVIEHVITHEIGHCLGLRHSDYFSRQSCGENSNEGSAGVGAIHIPGTPTGFDQGSLMNACFDNYEDGEFGYYDRVALEYLY